ncbi:STAS domain-containing protein [Dechloromonas sp. XY25]|uniref:STAS domain-containing protein n=1 Tax=Dechloromonas hankyongensis TaxID=2908002 RepID=A0ABS9K458_9RHOO|nr:STAS domain-containing protein [Dechloromonas hankyongensis]MCG2577957.1 STAS domain-containing protein [Dechloromonas hankyongensis]
MSSVCKIAIEGDFTIFAAQAIKAQLLEAFNKGQEVEVDLSAVSEMDSAGLQLMVAAKREAAAQGKTLRFIDHSPAVLNTMDLCDAAGLFADPIAPAQN